jgi:hypothetical protein
VLIGPADRRADLLSRNQSAVRDLDKKKLVVRLPNIPVKGKRQWTAGEGSACTRINQGLLGGNDHRNG